MQATSYEDVQYQSKPHYPMHADSLGTLGRLFGMQPALASKCRVLELGCATAMNIICMAEALPESEFVGLDLSPSQIAAGQQVVDAAGLKNIRLHAASIMDIDASWGKFDYILCHGVFSWVPKIVQDKLFEICRRLLTPQGIAYISYNTYPGWHQRKIVREMMKYHSGPLTDLQEKIQQARAIVKFMAKSTPDQTTSYAKFLDSELKTLEDAPDSYVFHEHLEEVNSPLYFHEFHQRASEHGLQYVSEAWQHLNLDELPKDVSESLQGISRDLIQLEQYADFLTNRTFRRTLLCQAEVQLDRSPAVEVISQLLVTALARPASETPDVRSQAEEQFRLDTGGVVSVNFPIVKAALVRAYRAWPQMVPFEQLLAESLADIADDTTNREEQKALLAMMLLRGHLTHFVALHREPFEFCLTVNERPITSPLARTLAGQFAQVPTRRHISVGYSPAERLLLVLADGTRTKAELLRDFAAIQTNDSANAPELATGHNTELAKWIEMTLQQFGKQALLVG
ncbi:methyltransferase regulatory domain-containing protein [Anatilimnocola sp. NA78]|uniref:methyltransferase regulatory domain-containing protein n=1 Tax=Anatilimnocola sp. NA78 TaxID=3415683 RepID=UPI003CE589FB